MATKQAKAELAARIAENRATNFDLRTLIEIATEAETKALVRLPLSELESIASDELSE